MLRWRRMSLRSRGEEEVEEDEEMEEVEEDYVEEVEMEEEDVS